MEKKKRKGFTLIELLVTIAIVSLITVVAIVSVTKIKEISDERKNKISITNIQTSARTYVEEFKRDDKYWFVNSATDNTEYACASVGMLMNKGFLKESILNTEIDGNTITRNTSVLIKRDRTKKVLSNEDLLFNSSDCKETNEIDIAFVINGEKGENNWYIGDVSVELKIVNEGQIQTDETKYTLTEDGTTSNNFTTTDYTTVINEEGKNIDFCITVVNLKDEEKTFCLSDENNKMFIDKTSPEISENDFKLDNNYNLIASNATDNITSSDNIKYYLTYDSETETLGSATVTIDEATRTTDKEVKVYVKDEAGNVSSTIIKTLNIADSQTETVTSDTKYYCSLDSTIAYNTESEATANCDKSEIGEVTSETKYYCSLDSTIAYNTESEATTNCITTTTGTVTSDKIYYCSLNDNEYSSKSAATSNCTEQGDTTTVYSCSSGTLSGTKCYKESSASEVTKYGLTCKAGTTYEWSSGSSTTSNSCSSKSASCSSSSHVGNTKVTCSGPYGENSSSSNVLNCVESNGCTCTLTGTENGVKKYKKVCSQYYTKKTYTCQANTGSKTYTGTTGGTTTGGCPSGTTETVDSTSGTCDGFIGDTCSTSCSSCCNETKNLTCTSSSSADKEYYCEEDGETYSSASSCEKTGSVTSDTEYYCSLNNNTYSSETSATNACLKTTTGTVSSKTNYFCSLDTNTYTSSATANTSCNKTLIGTVSNKISYTCPLQNTSGTDEQTQIDNCTNYCENGTYSNTKNACYSLN